jgi:hypothetical protein
MGKAVRPEVRHVEERRESVGDGPADVADRGDRRYTITSSAGYSLSARRR